MPTKFDAGSRSIQLFTLIRLQLNCLKLQYVSPHNCSTYENKMKLLDILRQRYSKSNYFEEL